MQFFKFVEDILNKTDLEKSNSLVQRVCSKEGAVEGNCRRINIDFSIIEQEESLKIFCITCKLKFKKNETKFYESSDLSSLVLTRNDDLGYPSVHGTFSIFENGTFSIENCGENCHVFIKHTRDGFRKADEVSHPEYDYSGLLDDEQLEEEVSPKYLIHYRKLILDRILVIGYI